VYVNGKMIPLETIPGMGRGENFCKSHNVSPPSTIIKINE
jgi:hypothetical protein